MASAAGRLGTRRRRRPAPDFATRSPAGTDAPPSVVDSAAQRDAPSPVEKLDDAERRARELARAKERAALEGGG